ncbi:YbcC family protein [Devosia sp.]|uniref:YbcC family protein n=1 Tax=Devosia sp. TaxID=1871048 RepID=UPI002EDEA922
MYSDILAPHHSRLEALRAAADHAARAIPPAFPLTATVAVNPFLGQAGEDLATAANRLARVAGIRVTPARKHYAKGLAKGDITDADLSSALAASKSPLRPLDLAGLKAALGVEPAAPSAQPTIATLAQNLTGTDWNAVIEKCLGLWAAGHFDRGQALWLPTPCQGAYAAWREWAINDLTPEIAGLRGFCAHVAAAPDTAERAILRAADRLGLTEEAAPMAFHRLLSDLGGWAQHARFLLWQAELEGESDTTLLELLAIRLVWEEALLAHAPEVGAAWNKVVAAHARPVAPTADAVIDAILQDAAERAHQRRLAGCLSTSQAGPRGRPALQAAFCIDVRSEVLRRALESLDPSIETLGFAGFFGLPLAHRAHGTDALDSHLPALLKPVLTVSSHAAEGAESAFRVAARGKRAWGRFRQAAVSSFAFVEAAGIGYGAKLLCAALGIQGADHAAGQLPRFELPLPVTAKADIGAKVLVSMGLTANQARLVLLVGHGTQVTNNPHESAYHCGACGGHSGEVSARVLADLLNDAEVRRELAARGMPLPADTLFVAALHVTTTDEVRLFVDTAAPSHAGDLARARAWLATAGAMTRMERATRLPGATAGTVARRALDWAELRPEWGLAGCAGFIAAPRTITRARDLGGRCFLHSYDWTTDKDFKTLELILTAPVVVASWISLQYYGSTVAPEVFGAGDKQLHNVVGGFGVVTGNGGRLRTGLPLQAVHDGVAFAHEPLRLSVLVEAPTEAMDDILARHPAVRALFDNGWLHLLALDKGIVVARYRQGLSWERVATLEAA